MTPYDFTHLTLAAVGDEIRGRTKLQKTVYFLGILTGAINELGYRPHFYGPYSDSVAAGLNRLKSLGFVTESTWGSGAIGAEGFEIARHDFKLTEEGKRIATEKAKKNPEVWRNMLQAAELFSKAGDIDYMRMSVAAKTYFMLKQKGKAATSNELSESARALGWNAKPTDIDEAIGFLEKLELVTASTVEKLSI